MGSHDNGSKWRSGRGLMGYLRICWVRRQAGRKLEQQWPLCVPFNHHLLFLLSCPLSRRPCSQASSGAWGSMQSLPKAAQWWTAPSPKLQSHVPDGIKHKTVKYMQDENDTYSNNSFTSVGWNIKLSNRKSPWTSVTSLSSAGKFLINQSESWFMAGMSPVAAALYCFVQVVTF